MIIMNNIPAGYEEYCETACAMYDGGWRAEDRDEMIEQYVNGKFANESDRWTEEQVDVICDLLERLENH